MTHGGTGGLNKTGWAIYHLLGQGSRTAQEVRSATSISISTARRVLCKLGEAGLAERLSDGQWRAIPRDLAEVAETVGTAGAKEKQAIRHQQERERHRQELEHLRERLPWANTPGVIRRKRARKTPVKRVEQV